MGATGLTRATGPAGIQGIQGIEGGQGPIGLPGMTYQGAWTNGTGYAVNDAVTYNGSTYIATQGNSSNRPDNDPDGLVVARGQRGRRGPQGVPGMAWNERRGGRNRACRAQLVQLDRAAGP